MQMVTTPKTNMLRRLKSIDKKIMRRFLFFSFLFIQQTGFAQSDSIPLPDTAANAEHISIINYLSVSVGQFHADFSNLNYQLEKWGAAKTFSTYNTVGINLRGQINTGSRATWDGSIGFEYFLPQDISIGDSLNFHLHGWHLMTSLYGFRIIEKQHFGFVAGPGIDWGNLKMLRTLNGTKTHYDNPFISPFARIELRFNFWKIYFGARASYYIDVAKGKWNVEEPNRPFLPNVPATGLGFQLFLGYSKYGY